MTGETLDRSPSSSKLRLVIGSLITLTMTLVSIPLAALQWGQTFGGPGADLGYDVTPSADGGAITVGLTHTDLLIDGFVVKTDAEGELVWERSLSLSPLAEVFYSVIPTPLGGAIIAGSADDPDHPNYRPWLLELDANGETVWSSEEDFTADLPVDSGIVRAVRLIDGRLALAGGANSFSNPEKPWVLLVGAGGEMLSFTQYETLSTPGFGVATYINSLEATSDGGFIATGTVSGGVGVGFLWKFGPEGHPQWDRLYQEEAFREGYAVHQLVDGGFAATGCDLPNCNNAAVLRTDATGQTVWVRVLDDSNDRNSFGRDILELPDGDLLLLQNLNSAAGSNTFQSELLTLSAAGLFQRVESLEIGSESTAGYRLSRSDDGALWATGYANDTTDPVEIDLFVALVEGGSSPGSLIFANGFEQGHTADWISGGN